jgi:hypothetical protein
MFFFIQEGTHSHSLRDNMRARGLSPSAMQMGDIVPRWGGGRTIEAFDDKFFD